MQSGFPDFVMKLPEIDAPQDGVKGFLTQGDESQSVFFMIKGGTRFPEHKHAAQWGIIVDGEFEITIGNQTRVYTKGDSYYIPENTVHVGYYVTDVLSFDIFDDKQKFTLKKS